MSSRHLSTIDDLSQRLLTGANVSIHGPGGIGKSELAKDVLAQLHVKPLQIIRVSCAAHESGRAVFQQIYEASADAKLLGDKKSLYDLLASILDFGAASASSFVIFIENFDSVVGYKDRVDFVRLFRELLESPELVNFCCLLVSRMPLEILENEVRGNSTLDGVFYSVTCPRLTCWDVQRCFPEVDLTDLQLRDLVEESGGVRSLVGSMVSPSGNELIGVEARRVLQDRWARSALNFLRKCELQDALAQYALGPMIDAPVQSRALLRSLGLLESESGVVGSVPECRALESHRWFVDVLAASNSGLGAWGQYGELEMAARHAVCSMLASVYGGLAEIYTEESIVGHLCCKSRDTALIGGVSVQSFEDLVVFLDAGDYATIVDVLWVKLVELGEERSKQYWLVRLSPLGGFGRSQGRTLRLDPGVVEKYSENLRRGFTFVKSQKHEKLREGSSRGPVFNVDARDGGVVSVANDGSASSAVSAPASRSLDSDENRNSVWDRLKKPALVLGVFGSLATVTTFILRFT